VTPMEAFRLLSPAAHRAVAPWLDRPLADYLGHLWQRPGHGPAWLSSAARGPAATEVPGLANVGRELFLQQLAESMAGTGTDRSTVDAVRRQLERVPIVQTADHTQLLLDPVMFANHVATMLGAQRGGCGYVVVLGSSVNSFTSRAGHGPGLLAARGGLLNVFGLRSRERAGSVHAHRGPVRFAFEPLVADRRLESTGRALCRLLGDQPHPSAAAAFQRANQVIWAHFGFHRGARLVQMDSGFSARLAARHLRLGGGEVWDLFFDPRVRGAFLDARRAVGADPRLGGFLRHQTDLVWGAAGGRLRPLTLRDGVLRDDGGHVTVGFEPAELAAGLDSGRLVPDICVTYLVQNILPDLCTLGGPSQLVYVPLMWNLFRPLLFRPPRGRLGATALVQGVLEVDPPPIEMIRRAADENAVWVAEVGERTLSETMGTMRAFGYLVGMASRLAVP
jgi:hypothetical protein